MENEKGLKLEELFKTQNVATLLEEEELAEIYQEVTQKFELDRQSCHDKITKLQDYMKLALLTTEEKSYPFAGAANAMLPLTVNAIIQFGATAFPPLVQDDQIVKFKVIGSDDGKPMLDLKGNPIPGPDGKMQMQFVGDKAARGKRMSTYMNYQINEEMTWWKRDLYQYLMVLAATGTVYKKIFYDPINKKCVSKFIMPDKIIINDNITSMEDAIITEILDLSPQKVMENIRNGLFIDYDFDWEAMPTQVPLVSIDTINPKQNSSLGYEDYRFLNQYTYLDLDEDGYPEPYVVTVDLNKSKVVRIIPDFLLDDVKYVDKKVSQIKRQQTFVDFIYIPSADGGHLGVGMGHLLYNLNNIANGTINQMLDAGHLSIKGGGFIGKNMNIRGGRFAMGLGEWKMVDNFGSNINDSIVPLPTPQVSPVLFQLLGVLIDAAKETGSLRDVLTGDTAANMAPTTYMGLVEQGLKQFLAIFKNIYDSMKQEFKLIRECNARNVTNEDYALVLDEPMVKVNAKADFSAKDCDLIPVADPSSVTSSQKMAQAQILQSLMQDPYYDPMKIRRMWNNAVQIQGLDDALMIPQPKEDPNMIFAQAESKKADVKVMDLQMKAQELDEKTIERRFKLEDTVANIKLKESQTLKNLADAEIMEKDHNLNVLSTASEAMTRRIEAESNAATNQIKQQQVQSDIQSQAAEQVQSEPSPQEPQPTNQPNT